MRGDFLVEERRHRAWAGSQGPSCAGLTVGLTWQSTTRQTLAGLGLSGSPRTQLLPLSPRQWPVPRLALSPSPPGALPPLHAWAVPWCPVG